MFLITIIAIGVIIFIIEINSIKNALTGIEYSQKPSLMIVEPDEEFDIVCILKNRTRRFVSYLKLQERFSREIVIPKQVRDLDYIILESSQYLMPRQILERRIRASIPERGRYFLYGATIYGGDFIGITEKLERYDNIEEIVVIPKETSIPDIEIKLSGYIGDMSINRFIFEDPILTVGYNDYTGQEPQKMISWVQTARVGHLMVKKYDYTLELMVTVILNIEFKGFKHDELIEECFSIARSVCQFLESRNIKYKIMTNAITAGTKPIFEDTEHFSWGRNYLMTILEGLGRASRDIIRESYDSLLNRAIDTAQSGVGHILITPGFEDVYIKSERDFLTKGVSYSNNEASYMSGLEKLRELTGHEVCVLTPSIDMDLSRDKEGV